MPVPVPLDRLPGSFDYYDYYEPLAQLLKTKSQTQSSSESSASLPAQWMRDDTIFELERRAIFSKVSSESGCLKSFTLQRSIAIILGVAFDIPYMPFQQARRLHKR